MDCLAQTMDSGRSTLCARQSMDGPDPRFAQNIYLCTVNCMSVEKLRTLHIAWLHRKVMVEDFRTQYAFFNGHAIDIWLRVAFVASINVPENTPIQSITRSARAD